MRLSSIFSLLAVSAALLQPLAAQAHRAFLVPSSTVLAGNAPWVSFDAAAASDVFFFDHVALKLDTLLITAPDGSAVKAENASSGKLRSNFDLHTTQSGTYKISLINDALMASYKENGVTKRWRGTAEALLKDIPASAEELQVSQLQGRVETFVTNGKPSGKALQVSGRGLEMAAISHPNDLINGEPAHFRMLLDGKPAAGIKIALIAAGIRYRQKLDEQTLTTDADGKFSINWQGAGMYWLEASTKDGNTSLPAARERRASYVATLEVLPQ